MWRAICMYALAFLRTPLASIYFNIPTQAQTMATFVGSTVLAPTSSLFVELMGTMVGRLWDDPAVRVSKGG